MIFKAAGEKGKRPARKNREAEGGDPLKEDRSSCFKALERWRFGQMVRRDGELEAAEVDCVDEVIPVAGSRGRHPGHGW